MKELLLYDCLSEFNRQFYKDVLRPEHIKGGEIKIDKVSFEDGSDEDVFNFWGWELKKDGIRYLLSCRNKQNKEVKIKSVVPLIAKDVQKIAHKGVVYRYIRKPQSVKFKSLKQHKFKEFVDSLCLFSHSNPTHQKLDVFMALASMWDRAYFRKSTPPGFGKDSIVDILGNLIGDAATIENPTIAKLEERASVLKWLAVNEVIDITKANWRDIEQILLAMGAFKPSVTKRSRAHGGVGETIDISNFSLTLMYNDINNYPSPDKYLDFVAKEAVLDRFVPLRLYGTLTEDFNVLSKINTASFVTKNIELYKNLIYSFTYYSENRRGATFDRGKLIKLSGRWGTNIGKLLNIIDFYCKTQEEFNEWLNIVNLAIIDYKQMLKYPSLYQHLVTKVEKHYKDGKKFRIAIEEINKLLKGMDTFIHKNSFIKGYKIVEDKEKPVKDIEVSSFWEK